MDFLAYKSVLNKFYLAQLLNSFSIATIYINFFFREFLDDNKSSFTSTTIRNPSCAS